MTIHRAAPCPTCGKTVALDKHGNIRWHRNTTEPRTSNAYLTQPCPGFRQPPATTTIETRPTAAAAIERIRAFLAAWDERHTTRDQVLVQVKPGSADMLTSDDLRALLAAADANEPAYVPSDCPHCPDGHRDPTTRPWSASMSVYRDRDRQPTHLIVAPSSGGHVAESDAEWLRQVIRDARARHAPLTDESCGVIPTPRGLDYLTIRRQQHPKAATDA